MTDALSIENVWKKYRIGGSKKLAETLSMLFLNKKPKEFWALKNINFKIKKGEKIGIIGPNGSGKSTLLKIISDIINPTRGSVKVNGKLASLLELGIGFHPELTGRENIYLYGAILGIDKNHITKNLSKIISFSGISKFFDTPIKHYSSGMYIRLAFSVVIHFDWDILLIDEALAVGDAQFQQKSFDKIKEMIKDDKTVVLVSHDLGSVSRLCDKVILLAEGKMVKVGKPEDVINFYLKNYI